MAGRYPNGGYRAGSDPYNSSRSMGYGQTLEMERGASGAFELAPLAPTGNLPAVRDPYNMSRGMGFGRGLRPTNLVGTALQLVQAMIPEWQYEGGPMPESGWYASHAGCGVSFPICYGPVYEDGGAGLVCFPLNGACGDPPLIGEVTTTTRDMVLRVDCLRSAPLRRTYTMSWHRDADGQVDPKPAYHMPTDALYMPEGSVVGMAERLRELPYADRPRTMPGSGVGQAETPPPVHLQSQPGPRTREIKWRYGGALLFWTWVGANVVTEGLDLLKCLHDAMPKHLQAKKTKHKQVGPRGALGPSGPGSKWSASPANMGRAFYNGAGAMTAEERETWIGKAGLCIGEEAAKDMMIALMARGAAKGLVKHGGTPFPLAGPAL